MRTGVQLSALEGSGGERLKKKNKQKPKETQTKPNQNPLKNIVEYLPSMCKTLGSIPSTGKKKKKKRKNNKLKTNKTNKHQSNSKQNRTKLG
jgi:hypothetical protein